MFTNDDLPAYRRGAKVRLFDPKATGIGLAIIALLIAGGVIWRTTANVDTTTRTEVVEYKLKLAEHNYEDFKLTDPSRGQEKENLTDKPDTVRIPDEKPTIRMSTTPNAPDVPGLREVIINPNSNVATPDTAIAIDPKDLAMAAKNDTTITDGPEEVSVTSEEVGFAISPIAVEVAGPADFFKYNTPAPRDRPALYTFNQGPRPGRPIKFLPKAFGDQNTPAFGGQPGPLNINLFGNGDFIRLMDRTGGGIKARTSVDSALHWLAAHQGDDGMWPTDKLEGQKNGSLASTALATLAFMGGGNTIRKGEYRRNVLRGLEAIMRYQKPDGLLTDQGCNLYTHAICTIALSEAYGRARDERIGAAAQKAVNFCIKAVGTDGGWRYTPNVQESDMSVTAWFIQALKTAKLAQLKVEPASVQQRALVYVDSVTDKGASKDSSGAVTYMYKDGQDYGGNGHPALTAAGMMVRQVSGVGVKNHILVKGAELTRARPPEWKQKDFYYWYYATYAMHNMGGEYRIFWNQKIRDVLLENQSREGDHAGSWDPKGDRWASHGGRTYTTALGALCLEVYYRYSEALNSFGTAPELDELFLE